MSETVAPAFTPEQWADLKARRLDLYAIFDDGTDQGAHRVAAACLWGQPFGFTREDCWQLDQAIMDAEDAPRTEPQITRLRSLLARISALLPPESPT